MTPYCVLMTDMDTVSHDFKAVIWLTPAPPPATKRTRLA
jgi:hypothetical protein